MGKWEERAAYREQERARRDREEYLDSPLWTSAVQLAGAFGTIIGVLTLILLIGYSGRGFAVEFPLGLILLLDVAINVAVRVKRRRVRRRAER